MTAMDPKNFPTISGSSTPDPRRDVIDGDERGGGQQDIFAQPVKIIEAFVIYRTSSDLEAVRPSYVFTTKEAAEAAVKRIDPPRDVVKSSSKRAKRKVTAGPHVKPQSAVLFGNGQVCILQDTSRLTLNYSPDQAREAALFHFQSLTVQERVALGLDRSSLPKTLMPAPSPEELAELLRQENERATAAEAADAANHAAYEAAPADDEYDEEDDEWDGV